jgi:hypothetical protein
MPAYLARRIFPRHKIHSAKAWLFPEHLTALLRETKNSSMGISEKGFVNIFLPHIPYPDEVPFSSYESVGPADR